MTVLYRAGGERDAAAIAALHADSWRRHYRGAYPDSYLDGRVDEDRRTVWSSRLAVPTGTSTTVAELEGELVGFVHVIFDAEPAFGPLVDNLHVRHDMQRRGIGEALMARAAAAVGAARPGEPMHLWVLEQNVKAQAFYKSIGGDQADTKRSVSPAGNEVTAYRVVWPEPSVLKSGVPHADAT